MSVGRVAVGGGLGTIVIMILALLFGVNPQQLFEQLPSDQQQPGVQTSRPANPQEDELKQFVAVVLAKSEDVWTDVFRQNGRQYREPTLVLSRFMNNCDASSRRPEISRRRTSSRMKLVITCRSS
jgi:predicted metalloprotease